MSEPVVSVVMPVFNAERHLTDAVESVLAQAFRDFELLVVDDGSTDSSGDILRSFLDSRIRVIRHSSNLGLVESLNDGIAGARGEWIARQDADDVSHPMRLKEQVEFVRGNPAISLIGADAELIDDAGGFAGRWRTGGHADLVSWELCFRTPFCHSTAFFRRSVAQKLGGYRNLTACEDCDLWSRFCQSGPVVTLRRPLVKYRQHASSVMANADAGSSGDALSKVLAAHIAHVCPGLESEVMRGIVGVWAERRDEGWPSYFERVAELQRAFFRGRGAPPGFGRVFADENYMLWNRATDRSAFLRALIAKFPGAVMSMPWIRMAGATVLR